MYALARYTASQDPRIVGDITIGTDTSTEADLIIYVGEDHDSTIDHAGFTVTSEWQPVYGGMFAEVAAK